MSTRTAPHDHGESKSKQKLYESTEPEYAGEEPTFAEDTATTGSTLQLQLPSKPPPNGGVTAWLQVLAAYFLFFNSWGMIGTFGTFQTYYNTALSRSASDIAWIGTFQGFLLMFLSGVTGPLFDKGYLRPLLISGAFLVSFGLMITSISTEYYQVFLAQGLVVGVGSGLLSVPGLAVTAQYFSTKRGLATGIVTSGGSMGSLVFPIVFERLQDQISFGWATRVIGFIVLGTVTTSIMLLKPRLPPAANSRALVDLSALRNLEFIGITLAMFFFLMGLYVPAFYVTLYAEQALGLNEQTSSYLLSVLNASSILGRAFSGPLADKLGSLNLMIPMTALTGLLQFAWISINSTPGIVVFCIFYGLFSSTYLTLLSAMITGIAPRINVLATWLGMNLCISSIGILIGNPIAGALLSSGDFMPLQIFGGALVSAGCLVFCFVRYVKLRKGITWDIKA